ncbi:4'-phosphopantetheinyl transferase superfamily protein [Orbus wheelerorum]|uniref:4'-phosphopantetheinyl transferase family protein n=1 Tax=Orbus wheelerorum TaxID=3074111 RepID=UPI00370D3B63
MLQSTLLSSQVIKQAENFSSNKQKQFVACRYLLAQLLNRHLDIVSLPNIKIAENSRPQFEKSHLPDFNISHSGDFIAVAISSEGRVGLDIEFDRPRKNILTIAKQFFSEQENIWLNKQINILSAFWQLWTLRESALKLYAKGVWQMKELEIMMPAQKASAKFATEFYLYHQKLEHIYLSVCCGKPIYTIVID